MLAVKRIQQNYDLFFRILKFTLKNADNPDFQEFSLVSKYLQLLKDLNRNMTGVFDQNSDYMDLDYNVVIESIFRDELNEYIPFIDSDEKKELVKYFNLVTELTDCAIDREGEFEVQIIKKEFRKMRELLSPLLEKIGNL